MTSFLFWNLRGRYLGRELAELASEHDLDVIVTAEPYDNAAEILIALNAVRSQYRLHETFCPRIQLFSRLPKTSFSPLYDDDLISISRMTPPLCQSVTLVSVHYWSKLHLSDYDQFTLSGRLRETLEEVENREGHRRTILVGDLNMDPFRPAMVNSEGIHAVMSPHVAAKQGRVVKGRFRHMFFNPMWSLLGNFRHGPPGTYFKDMSGEATNYFWHTFDQVLIRTEIVPWFMADSLQIATMAGPHSLVTANGTPDHSEGSDHLPILFRIDIPEVIHDNHDKSLG